jgi:hypothetical protein
MKNPFRERKPWSLATKLGVAVITFAIGIGAYWVTTFRAPKPATQQPTQQQPPPQASYESADPGTLRANILEAKARGENTVEIVVIGCGWDVGRLWQALSLDSVVLAELVGKMVQVQDQRDPRGTPSSSSKRLDVSGWCAI